MCASYRVLDADRHVIEPIEMWRQYLPAELRSRAPYLEEPEVSDTPEERVRLYGAKALWPLPPVPMLDGQPVLRNISPRAQVELAWSAYERHADLAAAASPAGQLDAMDRCGVEAAFLYPSFAACFLGVDTLDAHLGTALARAYNDWLRDYCSRDPVRLRGVGLMSAHDPASMVEEVERVASFGWTAVVVRPNPVKGRLLSSAAYEPFWSTCERLSVGVGLHEGTHTRLSTTGADRFESHFAQHACSHPMEQMMALLALIEGGVLERHPRLRVAFLEAGCGWLPYWLHRLDEIEYAHLSGEVAETVKRKPSEYFKRQCFVAVEPGEPYLPALIEHIGADNLLFGTDFPHLDHDNDIVDKALGLLKVLPEAVVRKILWDNPARFYALESSSVGS
ncbi:amidohydrolase family protein [Sorangium sp. So ce131]|uniref:amidohydrolase family protein n=1 Tax=Sorangium sp. So ce131 TaxID=3133282 RepID=UPI003F605B6E